MTQAMEMGLGLLRGLATCLKEANWIHCMRHPPQSPESFKQRVRRCVWHTLDELKEILQDEWAKITMDEVQARIIDMPK